MKKIIYGGNEIVDWVAERLETRFAPGVCAGIGILDAEGKICGGVVFDGYYHCSVCMHVAGETKFWLTRDFLNAVFSYAFIKLGVNKVVGIVDSAKKNVMRFDERLGFTLEATIKEATQEGDLLFYSMTKEQCRWIKD